MEINKKENPPTICAAIFLFRKGNILIGCLRPSVENKDLAFVWTVPGGKSEPGETIEATLCREIEEETGITDYVVDQLLGIVSGGKQAEFMVHVFIGSTQQNYVLREPDRFLEWRWINPERMPENFINPAAYNLLRDYLKKSSL